MFYTFNVFDVFFSSGLKNVFKLNFQDIDKIDVPLKNWNIEQTNSNESNSVPEREF